MTFMIGDDDVKAIGANEGDDGQEEKEDCRELMHDDRSRRESGIGMKLSRRRRGCGFDFTS